MQRDVVLPDVAAQVRVVDDDEQRGGGDHHQRQHLDELAQDVAVQDVRECDVEPPEHGLLHFRFRRGHGRGGRAAPARDLLQQAAPQARVRALCADVAVHAVEQPDADAEQDRVRRPHRQQRAHPSGDGEVLAVVDHDVVDEDDADAQRKARALAAAPVRDAERQPEHAEDETRERDGENLVDLHVRGGERLAVRRVAQHARLLDQLAQVHLAERADVARRGIERPRGVAAGQSHPLDVVAIEVVLFRFARIPDVRLRLLQVQPDLLARIDDGEIARLGGDDPLHAAHLRREGRVRHVGM